MTVICVLGMHKSGTSAAASLLHRLGVYLGPQEEVLGSSPASPAGLWEHTTFLRINGELLRLLGGSWDQPPPRAPGWEAGEELDGLKATAASFIEQQFGNQHLWGWKDPQTSVTLPFWQSLVGDMRYVLCIRNPVEVGASLEQTDQIALFRGMELWLEYNMAALLATVGQPLFIFPYDDYFDEPLPWIRRLAHFIGQPVPRAGSQRSAAVARAVDPHLRHHHATLGDLATNSQVTAGEKALYFALRSQSRNELGTSALDVAELFMRYRQAARERSVLLWRAFDRVMEQTDRRAQQLEGEVTELHAQIARNDAEALQRVSSAMSQIVESALADSTNRVRSALREQRDWLRAEIYTALDARPVPVPSRVRGAITEVDRANFAG